MHLIQAIEEFLINQIDQLLTERLKDIGTPQQASERKLAEKLKLVGVEATLSRPVVASSQSSVDGIDSKQTPANAALVGSSASSTGESSPASSPAPNTNAPQSSPQPGSDLVAPMAALSLSAPPAQSLPPVQIMQPDFKQFTVAPVSGSSEPTGQIKLRLTGQITWADFMNSTAADFEVHLKNELSKETLSDNKLLIVAWFKSQLMRECQLAKEELRQRAVRKKQDAAIKFDRSVDEWLLTRVEALAQESGRLIQAAHDHSRHSTMKVQMPFGGPEIEMKRSFGQTQLLIRACALSLRNFLQWCKDLNEQRRVSADDPRSMLDVYQDPQQPIHHLRQLDKQCALYVIENYFADAIVDPTIQTQKKSMFAWLNPAGHDVKIAKDKRTKLLGALRDITDIAGKHKESESVYWDGVLTKIDETNGTLKQCHMLTAYQQRTALLCREMHSAVLGAAQGDKIAETLSKHRKCFGL
jgi:hypothetical protein